MRHVFFPIFAESTTHTRAGGLRSVDQHKIFIRKKLGVSFYDVGKGSTNDMSEEPKPILIIRRYSISNNLPLSGVARRRLARRRLELGPKVEFALRNVHCLSAPDGGKSVQTLSLHCQNILKIHSEFLNNLDGKESFARNFFVVPWGWWL